jgi:hypothetical protein
LLTGTYELRDRHGEVYGWSRDDIVTVWKQPVDEVLAAGLPILPLAPVSGVAIERVPEVLMAISERLINETSPDQAATTWAATRVLMGLRHSSE